MDYKEIKCEDIISKITKCHRYMYDDQKFYSCVVNDLKDYIKYCDPEPVFESKVKKEN